MKKVFILCAALMMLAAPAQANHPGKHILITLNGLVCDFCAQSMKKIFGKMDVVESLDVDLTTKHVRLDMKKDKDISDEDIRQNITDAGYTVVSIERD